MVGYEQRVQQVFTEGPPQLPEVSTTPFGSSPLADYRALIAARFLNGPPMFSPPSSTGQVHEVA